MSQSNKVKLKVQQRSGFDLSHYVDGTFKPGNLMPILIHEVIPNTTINLGVGINAQLPPLASDTFMKVDFKIEAFFVPSRILYRGYEKWFSDYDVNVLNEDNPTRYPAQIPYYYVHSASEGLDPVIKSPILDSIGVHLSNEVTAAQNGKICLLPLLAYHKCWDDWYRAPLVQNSIFLDSDILNGDFSGDAHYYLPSRLNYLTLSRDFCEVVIGEPNADWSRKIQFIDGSSIFDVRQRNYGFDYFTNAWPSLQHGSALTVQTDSNGKFSIASLRAANSMQQFEERNMFSLRMNEAVHQRYGANLSDAVAQRSVFLGSDSFPLKTFGVGVNGDNNNSPQRNPFARSAGAELGRAVAQGVTRLIDGFTANEPGYIVVNASIVPHSVYSSGISRLASRYTSGSGSLAEMANPILQNTGNQPIYLRELNGEMGNNAIFGFTDRYADFMALPDRVFGLLKDGESLSPFALKRSFAGQSFAISSGFLQIREDCLDDVSATTLKVSDYGCWMQAAIDLRVVQPLAEYSVPSLQDPAYEHGETITVHRGGFRF